jgi:hypothetical protein
MKGGSGGRFSDFEATSVCEIFLFYELAGGAPACTQ